MKRKLKRTRKHTRTAAQLKYYTKKANTSAEVDKSVEWPLLGGTKRKVREFFGI